MCKVNCSNDKIVKKMFRMISNDSKNFMLTVIF